MIKRLHLLVFTSFIGPLILTFFIAEFVLIMQFLWLYISDLVGKGLEFSIIAELLLYSSAGFVKMALPLAVLLSSIMTFGSFGENFELSAMKSAGISLQRVMLPLTIFSVILCISLFYFSNNIIPYTNLKLGSLVYDVGNQRPEMNIRSGVFNNDIVGFSLKIKSKSHNSNMMYDFMVYDHREKKGNIKVTLADSGTVEISGNHKYMIITLYGGKSFDEMAEENKAQRTYSEHHDYFDKETLIFEIPSNNLERSDPAIFKDSYQIKTIFELQHSADSLSRALSKRKYMFTRTLSKSRIFKLERKPTNQRDSNWYQKDLLRRQVNPQKLQILANFDKIYSSMNTQEKTSVLKSALENAESIEKFIELNKEDLSERRKNIYKHDIAWHEKFSLSFACLIFFFIGAPLGAIIRKGGFGLPIIVSIIFFIVYYLISMMGRKFVEEGVWPPWLGMWLSSFLTMPLGVLFTYKATTDSVLFDPNLYIELIKRPFKVLEVQFKDPLVVFHKNVEIPDNSVILSKMAEIETRTNELISNLDLILKNIKHGYFRHFNTDRTSLLTYIDDYNTMFNILAVKFRDKKFVNANLEKFPKIDKEKYEISDLKLRINYLLLTIGLFPIGLLVMLNSYFKVKVLKQKIEIVFEQLKTFENML